MFDLDETKSLKYVVENAILKTDIDFRTLITSPGYNTLSFFLTSEGSEKLWNFEKFDLIVEYDADILGTKKRIVEQLTYNGTAGPLYQPAQPEFKVQQGTNIFNSASLDLTLTEGADFQVCTGDCFIMLTNTRHAGTGSTSGGTQNSDDWTAYVSDDSGLTTGGGTTHFTRFGTGIDNRVTWQIIEYVGNAGSRNEVQVLDTGVCTFSGGLTCTGPAVAPADVNDVAIIVTGVGNPNTGTADNDRCLVTTSLNGSNQPVFTRKGTTGINCAVSYAVVEWTGINWTVERVPHIGQAASLTTESITDVGALDRAFLFDVQQRNEDNAGTDGLCEVGEEVWLSNTNELSFNHPWASGGWDADMDEVVYVISNSETSGIRKMIVQRQQPTDQQDTSGPEEENWQGTINQLTYDISEAAIFGLTTQSNGCGTAFPRGSISALLTDTSTVNFWQSDSGQQQDYAFELVEFPRSAVFLPLASNEWTIVDIQNDNIDPGIINPDETAEIWAKLEYPIYTDGFVNVRLATDRGVIAGDNTIWYDNNWIYRKLITINSTEISQDLTDFPILVSVTDLDLREKAQAGGDDILFTTINGTVKLDHEIEKFDASTGELQAWVRIPNLSSSVDTEIYMYYGNPYAINQENVVGVWEPNYLGVWHFPSDEFLGVATQAAMDGADGSWAAFYGKPPIEGTTLNLVADEDQLSDAERSHTSEQVGYWVFNIENEFDILDSNNKIIGEIGIKENVDDNWSTVNLRNYYLDPVVVTTYNLDSSAEPPSVVRVRNADKYSFEVKLQNPGDLTTPTMDDVYYIVMEKGNYTLPGSVNVEAGVVSVPGVNQGSNWSSAQMIQINPLNGYTNPVVLGQVVTENDVDWSSFWSSDGTQTGPPTAANIFVGKMVGADGDTTRNPEDVGYIIIEQSQGSTNGVEWDAQLGGDTILGVDNSPPFTYTLSFIAKSFLDSTQFDSDGTNFGSIDANGKIGNAKEFDGTSDYVALNMFFNGINAIPEMTASAWVKVNPGEGDWSILDFDRSDYFTFTIRGSTVAPVASDAAKFHSNSNSGGSNDMVGNFAVADSNWHLVNVVYDGTDKIIYVNGTEDARVLNPHGGNDIGSTNIRYGFIGDGSEATTFNGPRNDIFFDGITDDVRFSIATHSDGWILTEYNNQNSPDTFLSFGIEEEYGAPLS